MLDLCKLLRSLNNLCKLLQNGLDEIKNVIFITFPQLQFGKSTPRSQNRYVKQSMNRTRSFTMETAESSTDNKEEICKVHGLYGALLI